MVILDVLPYSLMTSNSRCCDAYVPVLPEGVLIARIGNSTGGLPFASAGGLIMLSPSRVDTGYRVSIAGP